MGRTPARSGYACLDASFASVSGRLQPLPCQRSTTSKHWIRPAVDYPLRTRRWSEVRTGRA